LKFAITVSATVPVKQFVVIEAPSKAEALQALEDSVDTSVKESFKILDIKEISEEEFLEMVETDEIPESELPRSKLN
jgi:hypothetical protein